MRIGIILILLALLVLAHQFVIHGTLYDQNNLFSHEALAAFLGGAGVAAGVMRK